LQIKAQVGLAVAAMQVLEQLMVFREPLTQVAVVVALEMPQEPQTLAAQAALAS
jgi:hypothetical protein